MPRHIRVYRRLEGDLLRSGKIVLQVDDSFFDLTEKLWESGSPLLLSTLAARGWFEPERFDSWLDEAEPPPARPIAADDVLLPPLLPTEVGKILALGKNFRAHAEEFDEAVPEEPLFFNKLPETMRGHNQTVTPPQGYTGRFDHEVELAVVLGRKLERVDESAAFESIAGYMVANDLTLRTTQGADRAQQYPWFRAKNFDGACPIGPCFVPAAQLNPSELKISAHVNGRQRQEAHLRDLVVTVPHAISFLSQHLTLRPGDIVLMGTPAGVGPLEDGDEVVCTIQGIGELRTLVKR